MGCQHTDTGHGFHPCIRQGPEKCAQHTYEAGTCQLAHVVLIKHYDRCLLLLTCDLTRVLLLLLLVLCSMCRYFHCQCSLGMNGKQSVLEAAMTINLETMQPEPAEAARHQAEQASVVVRSLQLTEQQQEIVSVGMGLYYDLLAVIHHERQDINSQMSAVDEAAEDSGEAGSATSRASSTREGSLQDLPDRRERLQKQEALTNRLDLLLHKEVRQAVS